MNAEKSLVKAFSDVGTSEIPEAGASVREIILDVMKSYPDKWFTQKAFKDNLASVENIGHSNPYINNVLRKLAEKQEIVAEKRGRRVFYQAKKQ